MSLSLHFEQARANEVSGCQESLGEKGQSETYVTASKSHVKKWCGATKPVTAHAGKHGGEVFYMSKEEGEEETPPKQGGGSTSYRRRGNRDSEWSLPKVVCCGQLKNTL